MITVYDKIIYGSFALCLTALLQMISYLHHMDRTEQDEKKRIVIFCASSVLLMSLVISFCAFRKIDYGIGGTDAIAYLMQFKESIGSLAEQLQRFTGWEPLHVISLWIVRRFTENYTVYLCVYYLAASLCLIMYGTSFRLNRYSWLSTYALCLLFLNTLNTQRNTFAVFFGLLIVEELLNDRLLQAFILGIVATGIHFSAAIYFIPIGCFIIYKVIYGYVKTKAIVCIGLSLIAANAVGVLAFLVIGSSRLAFYERSINLPKGMILAFLILLFIFVHNRKTIVQDEKTYKMSLLYFSFASMFVFQLYYAIAYRLMLHSIPSMLILIWIYKDMVIKNKDLIARLSYIAMDVVLLLRFRAFFAADIMDLGPYCSSLFN